MVHQQQSLHEDLKSKDILVTIHNNKSDHFRPKVGNYFRPPATLCLYSGFAGHIKVKKAVSILADRMWPAGHMLPLLL